MGVGFNLLFSPVIWTDKGDAFSPLILAFGAFGLGAEFLAVEHFSSVGRFTLVGHGGIFVLGGGGGGQASYQFKVRDDFYLGPIMGYMRCDSFFADIQQPNPNLLLPGVEFSYPDPRKGSRVNETIVDPKNWTAKTARLKGADHPPLVDPFKSSQNRVAGLIKRPLRPSWVSDLSVRCGVG